MDSFAIFYGDWNNYLQSYKWQKLSVAARHLGILTPNAHTAAADALTTLQVVKRMAATQLSTEKRGQ